MKNNKNKQDDWKLETVDYCLQYCISWLLNWTCKMAWKCSYNLETTETYCCRAGAKAKELTSTFVLWTSLVKRTSSGSEQIYTAMKKQQKKCRTADSRITKWEINKIQCCRQDVKSDVPWQGMSELGKQNGTRFQAEWKKDCNFGTEREKSVQVLDKNHTTLT